MFNRVKRTYGIGNGFVDSLSWGGATAPQYPLAGTVLATACGSLTGGQNSSELRSDALGTVWNVNTYTFGDIADGSGGSSWQMMYSGQEFLSPCYLPYGFVTSGFSISTVDWNYQGYSGSYNWGNQWDVNYSDGNGGSIHESGLYEFNPNGYQIPTEQSWAEGSIRYISVGQWAFWYNYGYYLGQNSYSNDYSTSCWTVSIGGYTNNVYADGNGGTYESFAGGGWSSEADIGDCEGYRYHHNGYGTVTSYWIDTGGGGGNNYPSYGTFLDGSSSGITTNINWSGYDTGGSYVSGNQDIQIGTSYNNNYADGNGGSYNESGSSYDYPDYTDIFTAPYGQPVSFEWSATTDNGQSYNGFFIHSDDVEVWRINQGSTYMDRLYRAPRVSDGHVIWESSPYETNEPGVYWKTQVILQNGGYFVTTFTF